MVRELGGAAGIALCSLSILLMACEDEQAPAPQAAEVSGAPAAEPSAAAASDDRASEDRTPADTSAASETPPVADKPAVDPPRSRARRADARPSPKPKGSAAAWEDEVAPPGSEVGQKPRLPEWDPWERDTAQSQ